MKHTSLYKFVGKEAEGVLIHNCWAYTRFCVRCFTHVISLMTVVIKAVIITKIISLASAMFHLIYFPSEQTKATITAAIFNWGYELTFIKWWTLTPRPLLPPLGFSISPLHMTCILLPPCIPLVQLFNVKLLNWFSVRILAQKGN